MSHTFYNNLWADAQKDYRQIIREEKKAGKITGDRAKILDFLTEMCYKYVAIYDKMDRVHDQLVHPQKLPLVRRILDMLIARIIEIRETMVKAELSEYFYPDLYLHWLHLLPPDLDIKIPKYYKHGRGKEWLEHQTWLEGESIRKEMEEQEAVLDAEEEVEEKEENQPIVITLKTDFDDDIDLTMDEAIRAIQTMERARQGRARYAWAKYFVDEEEAQRKKKKMQKQLEAERGDPDRAATIIQRAIRRFLAKRKVDKMRNEELQFIGLSWGPYVPNSPLKEALDKIKEHKKFLDKVLERRRRMQRRYHENFIEAQETIEKRLRLLEAPEMEERMKWQIRTWAVDRKEKEGKVPALPKDEHGGSKFIFCPNQLPEDVLKKAMDAAQGKSSKNSKKDKAKAAREKALRLKKLKEMKKKKAKQKKKEGSKTNVELEPPKFYEDMLDTNKEYNKVWRRRDETHNPEQRHEDDMITIEKRELIGKEVRAVVDKMMRAELKLLKSKLDKKKKGKGKKKGKKKGRRSKRGKGRKGKKGKKRKKKGKKGKKDMTKNRTLQSLFEELVKNGIIRRYKKVNLDDLLGEPSIINGTIRKHYEGGYTKPSPWEDLNLRMPGDANPLPTFGDIKRAVKDICILPVGSATVHALSPYTKSVLFAGPPGSGKHTLLNAVCTEMGATLFDISAKVMRGKYKEKGKKKGLKLLMHLLEKVGTLCGPAVILIDDCEKMFQKRLPEEWKKLEPKRLKKSIKRFLKKRIKPENPIILIGITNQPWKAKGKAFKKLYQKVIYFPKPEYGSRLNWWREVLAAHYEHFEPNLNFSLLAKLSDSWTLGSIQKAVKALVNKFSQQEQKEEASKQETEASSETKPSANQVLPAATTPTTAPQNLVPTPLVSLSQAPQQQASTDENEATAAPATGKRLIRMDDILSHLSQQDPMFVEQEKAWTKWFNKTPLQRARLKSQVNLTGKKKKGDKGKNKGRSRPGGRGKSSRSRSRRR